MVLITSKKIKLIILGIVLSCISSLYSQSNYYGYYFVSSLVQYPPQEKNDALILTKEHIKIKTNGSQNIVCEYIIKNLSEIYETTLGIAINTWSAELPRHPIPKDFQLMINDKEYKYEILENNNISENSFSHLENWVIVNYIFPANSETIVLIQYTNPLGPYDTQREPGINYNDSVLFNDDIYWEDTPEFILEIDNSYIGNGESAELFWISDIVFKKKKQSNYYNSLFLSQYLIDLQELNDNLFTIQKTSPTTWRIDFTQQFVKQYERSFSIIPKYWVEELGAYCYIGNGIQLTSLKNEEAYISLRNLGPYEFIFLTNKQLAIMRNAFYAQYGYVFTTETMKKAFPNQLKTYFSLDMLTEIDKANIETIQQLERMVQ
jgi:hypothetical protein